MFSCVKHLCQDKTCLQFPYDNQINPHWQIFTCTPTSDHTDMNQKSPEIDLNSKDSFQIISILICSPCDTPHGPAWH